MKPKKSKTTVAPLRRTQIMLGKEERQAIRKKAFEENRSMSSIIREAVRSELRAETAKDIQGGPMQLGTAPTHIRKRATKAGRPKRLGKRTPRNNYKKLMEQLTQLQRDMSVFADMSDKSYSDMFQEGKLAARMEVAKELRTCIDLFVTLRNKIPGIGRKIRWTRGNTL